MMTEALAEILAVGALQNVEQRMRFAECYDEGVRNVAAAIQAAVEAETTRLNADAAAAASTYYGM